MLNWIGRKKLKDDHKNQISKSKKQGERLDEKAAKDLIVEHMKTNFNLNLSSCEIEPKFEKHMPDYVLHFESGLTVMLEITQGGVFTLKDDEKINYIELERRFNQGFNSLQNDISVWVRPTQTIILYFDNITVVKFNKTLFEKINQALKKVFANNSVYESEMQSIKIEGFEFSAKTTEYYANLPEYSPLKLIYDSKPNPDLQEQAIYCLQKSINKKEEIYKDFMRYEKWLAIISMNPIIDHSSFSDSEIKNIYQNAYRDGIHNKIIKEHSFKKIFIIFLGQKLSESVLEIDLI